ncbi:MAG TPA: hypothetical protein VLE20_00280, partial [Blastocatellia bacterium]|nr:hypothetical protein [Blastocatellia bacterium]
MAALEQPSIPSHESDWVTSVIGIRVREYPPWVEGYLAQYREVISPMRMSLPAKPKRSSGYCIAVPISAIGQKPSLKSLSTPLACRVIGRRCTAALDNGNFALGNIVIGRAMRQHTG